MDYSRIMCRRVQDIQPSGIRKYFDLLQGMEGGISLGIGEPDFQTPWHIRDAGIFSLEKGFTKYTPNAGLSDLRSAISRYLKRRFDLSYAPVGQILVTVGGSEGLDLTFRTLLESGDEVIIPTPSFVCYGPLVSMAHAVPVLVETRAEHEFRLTAEELRAAITPKTKAVVLNYPGNPTGVVMSQEELNALAEVLLRHNVLAVSDEIYAELIYNGQRHASIAAAPGMRDMTILISGVSKSLAMTGWRIGYVCAHPDILSGIYKIHQFSLSCASTTGQYVALEGLRHGQAETAKMVAEYDRRRQFIVRRLAEIGMPMCEPQGAFYAFPSIAETGLSSNEFCERLLREEKVACVPGNAFGVSGEGYIRCSYATSLENIARACDGIERFVNRLK